jgi:hypothetical protein
VTLPVSPWAKRTATFRTTADDALELAESRLAGVALDDPHQRLVGYDALGGVDAALLELTRKKVAPGDCELLVLAVAREAKHFHSIQERPGNGVEVVRRRDEEDLREIERQIEIVVAKAVVLLRVENLEHRRRGVSAEVASELVDLVEHQHGVVHLDPAKGL